MMIYINYPNEIQDIQELFILLQHVNYLENGKVDEDNNDPNLVERIKCIDVSCAINRWFSFIFTKYNRNQSRYIMKNIIKFDESISEMLERFGVFFRWNNKEELFDISKELLIRFVEIEFNNNKINIIKK